MPTLKYPSEFPLPLWQGYNYNVNMEVIRTPMDTGYPRQRRRHKSMPHLFNVTFRVKQELLGKWQRWINEVGYQWFVMPVADMYSSEAGKDCSDQQVRFTADLQIALRTPRVYEISTQMEISPRSHTTPAGPPQPIYDWIIAKTPADPSIDVYIAKRPDAPATDTINPGNPAQPAAVV
jgi:hypothetical protein